MTAARGVIHSEMPEQEKGSMKGFQLWLNLPSHLKMSPPSYKDFKAQDIPYLQKPGLENMKTSKEPCKNLIPTRSF